MSQSFREQIKNIKSRIQEKKQLYIEQEQRQNTEIQDIKTELQNIKNIVCEMEIKIQNNLNKENETKLKDFDEIFNVEMEKLKADLLELIENSEIITTTPRNTEIKQQMELLKTELNTQTDYIKDMEQKIKDLSNQFNIIQSKPKIILHKK